MCSSSHAWLLHVHCTCAPSLGRPGFLSKRDAWAGSFHDELLPEPRTDTPQHLPEPPPPSRDLPTRHGCAADESRRQVRRHALLESILEGGGGGGGGDDDGGELPLLGDNPVVGTEGADAMTDAIGRKAQMLLDGLEDGSVRVGRLADQV